MAFTVTCGKLTLDDCNRVLLTGPFRVCIDGVIIENKNFNSGASAGATPKSALTPGLAPAAAPRPAANRATVVLGLLVLSALLYLFIDRFWRPRAALMPPAAPAVPERLDPPPHSVAVLPFANMSGDPKDEYFSDGLSEELLELPRHHPRLARRREHVVLFVQGQVRRCDRDRP